MNFKEIDIKSLRFNPFSLIEDGWFLITSQYQGKVNTMTAASGCLGHMFRKNVAYLNIRPTRYTKQLIDSSMRLSLSFFENTKENKQKLTYLGTVSGRDEPKLEKSGLRVLFQDDIPFIGEAKLVFLCTPIYVQSYSGSGFLDSNVERYYYPQKDYHDLYICDITKALIPEEPSKTVRSYH
ncbi:MAG: flavin reductase family protein [Lachnospiraceae bacterium]